MLTEKIGRFEIISEISRFELGSVYKATDTSSGQTVALKTLRLDLVGEHAEEWVQHLLQEAQRAYPLSNQHLATLYSAEKVDGYFCAAMEYVEGLSIAAMIAKDEGFSIWDLLDISRQVCHGLDYAHSKGIIHYSLQPANILVQWDGTVKILSFGISIMGAQTGTEHEPWSTLYYMSPEQVRGDVLDARSNLFSWGAALYEMATQRLPFDGETVSEISSKILEQDPADPQTIQPKMHPQLSALIMKALAKDPAKRYQSGREMLADLEACREAPKAATGNKSAKPSSGLNLAEKQARDSKPRTQTPRSQSQEISQDRQEADTSELVINAAGAQIAAKQVKAKAAAAGAETAGKPAAEPSSRSAGSRPRASAASFTEEEVQAPAPNSSRFAVDPMMAREDEDQPKPKLGFSDIDELPPLKEAYVAPQPTAPTGEAEEEEEEEEEKESRRIPATPHAPIKTAARDEKIKIKMPPVPKVDPKLVLYGVGGAAAVIVLFLAIIGLYVHFQGSNDQLTSAPPATQPANDNGTAPAPEPAAPVSGPQPQAPQVEVVEPEKPSVVTRRFKRKASEPQAAPVIIPGQLAVSSTPEGAQIQVDGRTDPSWVTPFTLPGLEPGTHTITISKPGYTGESRTVEIASAGKSFLVVRLSQAGANVSVNSDPPGAAILVDGHETGRTTPAQLVLDKGAHAILLRKTGYLDETTSADLQPGQNFQYAPRLKPLGMTEDIRTVGKFKKLFGGNDQAHMGRIAVRTNPKGAQIAVNQRLVDKASPVEFFLNPGNYIVDITLSGYVPIRKVITVNPGDKLVLDENMQRQ
jgi:serine/threonine protein kinase